ncbi:MAG: DinB family protein [Planctomycetota bacterium]
MADTVSPAVEGLITAGQRVVGYAALLRDGIAGDRFARFAVGTSGAVDSNHPAFVFGHLSLYPSRVSELLGLDLDVRVPEPWQALFAPGAACVDDPDGTVYPSMESLVAIFDESHERLFAGMAGVTLERLAEPTPHERYRQRFPTTMSAVTFLLTAHPMLHLGQLSAWRRFEGLGPAA